MVADQALSLCEWGLVRSILHCDCSCPTSKMSRHFAVTCLQNFNIAVFRLTKETLHKACHSTKHEHTSAMKPLWKMWLIQANLGLVKDGYHILTAVYWYCLSTRYSSCTPILSFVIFLKEKPSIIRYSYHGEPEDNHLRLCWCPFRLALRI